MLGPAGGDQIPNERDTRWNGIRMRLPYVEIEPALPPFLLVPWLDCDSACSLDSGSAFGWRSAAYGRATTRASQSLSSLVATPEKLFRGGRSALLEALDWLGADSARPARAASLTGYLAYELGEEYEPIRGSRIPSLTRDEPAPNVWLGGHRAAYYYCSRRRRGWVEGESRSEVRRLAERIRAANAAALRSHERPRESASPRLPNPARASEWAAPRQPRRAPAATRLEEPTREDPSSLDLAGVAARHASGVERIQDWIREGDVYQVNLSRALVHPGLCRQRARRAYAELQTRHPAPFGAFLDLGDRQILSNSPERFLRVSGRHVETRPIKGTRPRGRSPEEDSWQRKSLITSEKDRAEHVMIVDLERNDLGRVAELGSVRVEALAAPIAFATVHHLESSVQASLRQGVGLDALLAASFPGGSITGAPKIRAREIIAELEAAPRGVYTGAIACLDASGELDLSIAIRTAVVSERELELRVGGGIVADSTPAEEFEETCDKARAFSALIRGR